MNSVILIGRLTADPEGKEDSYARFTLAVDRKFKKEGEQEADFISCVAFKKRGDFVLKYLKKGTKIAIEGSLQTSSYEKDGQKRYSTDVIANSIEFAESKKSEDLPPRQEEGFINVPQDVVDSLPFKTR